MSYTGPYGGASRSCRSYCNGSGYHHDGFSCGSLFCCGSVNVRYCCNNSALDVASAYSEKCRCPMSSCSYLSWDILLPCTAAALFVFLMVAICCCHGCRGCVRCRQFIRRRCHHSNPTTAAAASSSSCSSNGSGRLPETVEEEQRAGDVSAFPPLPPYEFGPPKYESIELAEGPPKYEDIMTQGRSSEVHFNSAFVGDSVTIESGVTPDRSVTPDYPVTPEYSSMPDCTVTADDRSSRTMVSGASVQIHDEHDRRMCADSHSAVESQGSESQTSDTESDQQRPQTNELPESPSDQSPPNPALTPNLN